MADMEFLTDPDEYAVIRTVLQEVYLHSKQANLTQPVKLVITEKTSGEDFGRFAGDQQFIKEHPGRSQYPYSEQEMD